MSKKLALRAADITELVVMGRTVEIDGVSLTFVADEHSALGSEIKDFYMNGWDSDYYYEDGDASVPLEDDQGNWILDDNLPFSLADFGTLCWHGTGDPADKGKKSHMEFEEAFLAWKRSREFDVTVNGQAIRARSPMSYSDILIAAGYEPHRIITVTYHRAKGPKEDGMLIPGQSVELKDGTFLSAADTSNA